MVWWVIWVRLFVQSLIKGGMDKLKKFLSFFGFCLLVGAVFNFLISAQFSQASREERLIKQIVKAN